MRNVIASIAKTLPAISAIFPAIAACLPIGTPHWMRSPAHLREISSSRLETPTHAAGKVSRPGVQRRKRDFQSGAFFGNDVFARHAHIGELDDCVIKRAQSHEPAAICDLQSRRIDIDNECRDLFALLPVYHLGWRPRHHHEHPGFDTVRAPKLFAI